MSQRQLYGFPHDGDLTRHNLLQALFTARARGQAARCVNIWERITLHERVRSKGKAEPVKLRGGHRRAFRC